MNSIVTLAPVAAAAATTLAAGAAYWSASTSARTARRADSTSARAVEALGRATMPRLTLHFHEGPNDQFSPGPVTVRLEVVNEGENGGLIRAVSAHRRDGVRLAHPLPRPVAIGTPNDLRWGDDRARMFPLGVMARTFPDPASSRSPGATFELTATEPIVLEVEFSDLAGLVVWRLRDRYVEHVQRVEDGDPIWTYGLTGRAELEIINDLGRVDDRAVGWVRRQWRRLW